MEEKDNQDIEVFDKAFDEATGIQPKEAENSETLKKQKEQEDILEAPAVSGEPKEEPKEEPKGANEEQTFEQRWKSLQGIYRHDKEEWSKEREKLLKEIEALKKTEAQNEPPKKEEKIEPEVKSFADIISELNLTDEQKEQLMEYESDYDVISKMEGLKRSAEMKKLKSDILEVLKSFEDKIQTQLKPASEFIEETKVEKAEAAARAHFEAIEKSHPDYTVYRDDGSLLNWIKSKPKYLQPALLEVYKSGTAEDVIALISDFKDENGITQNKVVSFDKAKADRKAAMMPPPAKRGAVGALKSAAETFEDAFDEALQKLKE